MKECIAKKAYIEAEHEISDDELKKAVSRVGNYKVIKIETEGKETKKMKPNLHLKHEHSHNDEHQGHEHDHSGGAEEREIKMWKRKMFWS